MGLGGYEQATGLLRERGVNPSHQRVRVLAHLLANQDHPTAESIHKALLPEMTTLSKMTVYNTLRVLLDAGLARIVHIEDNETRYDVVTGEHGHFKCEDCGAIFDFKVEMDPLSAGELPGFRIRERNVYFKGICPKCLENNKG